MGFFESIKSAFINCLNFKGRTNRNDFWYYVIFFAIMLLILYFPALKIAKELRHGSYFFISPLLLAMPLLSLTYRRLNDAGKTQWWWKVLAFFCFYSLFVFIVIIFHHPDLEFKPDGYSSMDGDEGYIPGDIDPYVMPLLLSFLPLLPLFLLGVAFNEISHGKISLSPIEGTLLNILIALIFLSPYVILFYALSRQTIKKDEEDEDTTEEEGPTEKDKKLGIAGIVFLFVVAALVIGIPVMEIIRLTSAA